MFERLGKERENRSKGCNIEIENRSRKSNLHKAIVSKSLTKMAYGL